MPAPRRTRRPAGGGPGQGPGVGGGDPPDETLEGAPPARALVPLQSTPLADAQEPPPPVQGYGTRDFYHGALDDEKGRPSFIKEVVAQVRRCPEMSRYRGFLTENVQMDKCSVLSGLSAEESLAAGLELHHHPLTLYDVAELVLGKMEVEGDRITTMSVANRVMALHWQGKVGLVPPTASLHELAHAGQLAVDPRSVYGDWPALLEEHSAGLTEHLADKLRAEASSWRGDAAERNARLLEIIPQRWSALPPTRQSLLEGPEEDGDAG